MHCNNSIFIYSTQSMSPHDELSLSFMIIFVTSQLMSCVGKATSTTNERSLMTGLILLPSQAILFLIPFKTLKTPSTFP